LSSLHQPGTGKATKVGGHEEGGVVSLLGLQQSKALIETFRKERRELLKLSREDIINLLVGLLTGHSSLRKHLMFIRLTQTGSCRFCEKDPHRTFRVYLSLGYSLLVRLPSTEPEKVEIPQ
jgi:hypothetical protein